MPTAASFCKQDDIPVLRVLSKALVKTARPWNSGRRAIIKDQIFILLLGQGPGDMDVNNQFEAIFLDQKMSIERVYGCLGSLL